MMFGTNPGLPKLADLITGDLAEIGHWVVGNVEGSIAWPLKVTKVKFREHTLLLVPKSETSYPFVALKTNDNNFKAGQKIISQFLSSLTWVEGNSISVKYWSGGSRPHPMGFGPQGGNVVTQQFELDYLPDPNDERTRWALAFYREGLSLNNVAYAALSFFKIINIFANNGPRQKAWINGNISHAGTNNFVKFEMQRRLDELKNAGVTDVGEYLYASGRCAIAHAGDNPTIDPENPDDLERLTKDLPLIKALAAYAIEKEFGIKSRHTIWQEHLYELAGFKELLGKDLSDKLSRKENINVSEVGQLPKLNIRIQGHDEYLGLKNLHMQAVNVKDGVIDLVGKTENELSSVSITLDFAQERINFDLESGLAVRDNGTELAVRQIASILKFVSHYLANGKLQIMVSDTGKLLGRKDAYLPCNIDLGRTLELYRQQIAECDAEADRRSQRASRIEAATIQSE